MPDASALSANAVAVLRFEIKGWRAKDDAGRLPAYRELTAAGIMEPVSGFASGPESSFRFTCGGWYHIRECLVGPDGLP
jgi:hypothetical protein